MIRKILLMFKDILLDEMEKQLSIGITNDEQIRNYRFITINLKSIDLQLGLYEEKPELPTEIDYELCKNMSKAWQLNLSEARMYIYLLKINKAVPIFYISKKGIFPRSECYQIIYSLNKKGLVNLSLFHKKLVEALSPNDVIPIYLADKFKAELEQAKKLLLKFKPKEEIAI